MARPGIDSEIRGLYISVRTRISRQETFTALDRSRIPPAASGQFGAYAYYEQVLEQRARLPRRAHTRPEGGGPAREGAREVALCRTRRDRPIHLRGDPRSQSELVGVLELNRRLAVDDGCRSTEVMEMVERLTRIWSTSACLTATPVPRADRRGRSKLA